MVRALGIDVVERSPLSSSSWGHGRARGILYTIVFSGDLVSPNQVTAS